MSLPDGYQPLVPPRMCTCGHPKGDHKSNGSWMWLRYGICLVDGCDCREYQHADDKPDAGTKAAA